MISAMVSATPEKFRKSRSVSLSVHIKPPPRPPNCLKSLVWIGQAFVDTYKPYFMAMTEVSMSSNRQYTDTVLSRPLLIAMLLVGLLH
jgi:hypothetical protein